MSIQCKKCKKGLPDDALYCLYCGAPQRKNPKKKMYQRPDGLYEQKITITGKRIAFRGRSEAEVLRKIGDYRQKQESGPLFGTVCDEWEAEVVDKMTYGTQKTYLPALKRARDEFGESFILEISAADVHRFIQQVAATYAGKTVQNQKSVLQMIFSFAIIRGYTDNNPCAFVRLPKGLRHEKRMPPEDDQSEAIKANVDRENGLLPYFLLYTGCRIGEALAIRYCDIDWDRSIIRITKSVYFQDGKPHLKEPKTEAGTREIILLDRLKEHLLTRDDARYIFFDSVAPATESEYLRRWRAYCRDNGFIDRSAEAPATGIKYTRYTLTPHQIRHAYATMLYEAGVEAKDAQDLLGHADESTTKNTYMHIRLARKKETADKLNASSQI